MPGTYRPSGMTGESENIQNKSTADELLNRLYSKNIPEPTFDQDKADRLQRMGKLNQLGRSVNVLGDIFGTAIGNNTRRRQPDTTAPALYQSYQANLDKYKAEKDANLLRDYDKERQDILHQISRADRQEGIDIAQKRFDAQQRMQAAKNNLELQKYLAGLTQKERQIAIQQKNADSNRIRANKAGASKDKEEKPDKPFMVAGVNGQDVPLTQGQFRDLLAEATQAANKAGTNSPQFKDFQATMESFKDNPLEGQKNIVQRYYSWKKEQESLTRNREKKANTQPIPQSAPKTNKTSIYTF